MLFLLLLLVIFILFLIKNLKQEKLSNFPTGPSSFPIIGSLLSVGFDLKDAFKRWRAEYGPIVGFKLGNQLSVVISDFDMLSEAFKDDRFCGRPANLQEVFSAFFTKDKNEKSSGGIVFSHGDHWREQRRFAMRTLKEFGVGKSHLQTVINDEVARLVDDLKDESGESINLKFRTNLAVVNTLWQILNGEKSDPNNPEMEKVFRSTAEFIVDNNMAGPVMIMPWLRHLPFFNTKFEQARRSPQEMRKLTSMTIKKHMDNFDEEHQRDFIDCYIKKMKETSDEKSSFYKGHGEGNIQRTVMDLFGAGSETTSSVLTFAFNYLIRYPDIQRKVQAEIDAVIGSRIPLIEDRPNMPYTDAVIHEVLRHSNIIYTTPHATTEEVQFHGHTLPAGTAVYANVTWIMNDPEYWDKPEQFNPERFIDESGQFRKDERCIPFLIGKRYCLGQQLAQHELFLFLTGLLQSLSFSTPLKDPSLVNIEPVVGFMHSCPDYNVIVQTRK